jgi:hypothetical protein
MNFGVVQAIAMGEIYEAVALSVEGDRRQGHYQPEHG